MILCIDLGTDLVPAVSFAYELPELDIMQRMPRNSKRDHLVSRKVIGFSYLTTGVFEAFALFYAYINVMNDYGIRPTSLLFLTFEDGYFP